MGESGTTRRVGVRDVARAAGVSPQTVSRVLNDYPGIRDETRRRVLDAVAALDYRMNNAARSLGTATTRTLGLIASDATLYGPSLGIAELERAARAVGRWIATAYADAADEASVVAATRHLVAQGVDALVVLAPHARTLDAVAAAAPGLTVAALHTGVGAARQSVGGGLPVEHLAALGHERIARISGPSDWLEATARDAGVEAAFARLGLQPGPRWHGDWTAAAGAALAPEVAAAVRGPGGPTAVVVANDQMALGLMAGLRAAGLDVPDDVSVAGFDDNPDAAFYRPTLTTVRLDLAAEARRIVAEAVGEASGAPEASAAAEASGSALASAASEPTLVIRASTAPPR